MASSGNQFRLWAARAAPTVTGLTITSPSASLARVPYTDRKAIGTDTWACMPAVVTQDDEAVDVAAVCYHPNSPAATSIALTGTATQYFKVLSGTKLAILDAARATIPRNQYHTLTGVMTNAQGASDSFTLNIWVPNDTDCVFFSPTGNDTTGTGAYTAPYKHVPRTPLWTGTGGANAGPTFNGKTLIFEGGRHQHEIVAYTSGIPFATDHHDCHWGWHSWKGQAKLSGDTDEAGSHTTASSAETYASPATGTLEKVTVGTAIRRDQSVFWGLVMGRMAQYPRPNDLMVNEDPTLAINQLASYDDTAGTSDGGFKRIFHTTNSSDTTTVRFFYNTGGVDSYIQDAKLDARFNNASVARDTAGIGQYVKVLQNGNNVDYVKVLEYDVTLHRMYFNAGSTIIQTQSSYTAYALLNSPYDVQVVGQYATTKDQLTVIEYRPASPGQFSVARLAFGLGIGLQANNVHHQLWVQRYSGGSGVNGGTAVYCRNNSGGTYYDGIAIYGLRVHQMNQEDQGGLGMEVNGDTGIRNFIFDKVHYSDNWRGRGLNASGPMLGLTTGSGAGGYPTKAEVKAYAYGKLRWAHCDSGGMTRTMDLQQQMRGVHHVGWSARKYKGVHADGHAISVDNPTGVYYDHNLHEEEFIDCALRWQTSSINDAFLNTSMSNWYDRCIWLGDEEGTNFGIELQTGNPGAIYDRCIFIQSPDSAPSTNSPCLWIGGGWGINVTNSILNGFQATTTMHGAISPTWTVDNCGMTSASYPADDAANSRRVTNITSLSALQRWDGVTIPTAWKTILQAGATVGTTKIGLWHYV